MSPQDQAESSRGAIGRVLRFDHGQSIGPDNQQGGQWQPVGEPLPPFRHAPPSPSMMIAPWVLPRDPAPQAHDVVVVGELAHQLVIRCEPDDPVYQQLVDQTLLFHGTAETLTWLEGVEVWMGRRLDPGRPWPRPPRPPRRS